MTDPANRHAGLRNTEGIYSREFDVSEKVIVGIWIPAINSCSSESFDRTAIANDFSSQASAVGCSKFQKSKNNPERRAGSSVTPPFGLSSTTNPQRSSIVCKIRSRGKMSNKP